jgi:hypothetical protein
VPVFAEVCLPLTMKLARLARAVIMPALADTPAEWAYEDRVLVILAPSLRDDVGTHHAGVGPDMATTFQGHQLDHLDRDLVKQLAALLHTLSPTTAAELARVAALPDAGDP